MNKKNEVTYMRDEGITGIIGTSVTSESRFSTSFF